MEPQELRRLVPEDASELFEHYVRAGQEHVFRFLPDLGPDERRRLFAQAAAVDLDDLPALSWSAGRSDTAPRTIEPIEAVEPTDPDGHRAVEAGRDLLAAGRVAFLTVAGGQATRLGHAGPKGCFPIGPVSGKSLFRWHAEKVLAASRRYGAAIPWIVLVSDATADPTTRYFREERWFGLEGRIRFIRQGMLPVLDSHGRLLLSDRSRLALAPNGHGGVLEALGREGAIEWLQDLGIEVVSYFQVDNALVNPADPAFLGTHVLGEAEMSAKVVAKEGPFEKAGVICRMDGKPGVLEYSELDPDLATATGEKGELLLSLVNIAAHLFSVPFLERVHSIGLPHHAADKQIPSIDEQGEPTVVSGRKFETFVFDAIPLARGFNVFLTDRAEEFSPLKNREGENSPRTAADAICARTRGWYRRAGLPVPTEPEDLEISPLTAYDYETFREHLEFTEGGRP